MSSVYDIVTERLIAEMERTSLPPWRCPWVSINGGCRNYLTGRPYSLLNNLLLSDIGPGFYATYDQWSRIGCKVKKNAKRGVIVFWKMQEKENEDGTKTTRPVLRFYGVFHIHDVLGNFEPKELALPSVAKPLEEAEELLNRYLVREGVEFREEPGNQAYYSVTDDSICVPAREQFLSSASFYDSVYHELSHSTGSPYRLNRPGLKQDVHFGSLRYGEEELIAEISAAIILHTFGMQSELTNQAAYTKSWMKAIQADHRLFIRAAGAAERAVNYIFNGT